MSASSRRTDRPLLAIEIARFVALNVLPSSGTELVTRMVCRFASRLENNEVGAENAERLVQCSVGKV